MWIAHTSEHPPPHLLPCSSFILLLSFVSSPYVCTCVCAYVCSHTCVCAHTCVCVCVRIRVCVCARVWACAHLCVCTHMYVPCGVPFASCLPSSQASCDHHPLSCAHDPLSRPSGAVPSIHWIRRAPAHLGQAHQPISVSVASGWGFGGSGTGRAGGRRGRGRPGGRRRRRARMRSPAGVGCRRLRRGRGGVAERRRLTTCSRGSALLFPFFFLKRVPGGP